MKYSFDFLNHNNLMLDIETLDTEVTAKVLSIGAVAFNKYGILDQMQLNVDRQSQTDRTESEDTLIWWSKQGEDKLRANQENTMSLMDALSDLVYFIKVYEIKYVWGNGADFDNAIVANCYYNQGKEVPWKYYHNRCFRTFTAMFPALYCKSSTHIAVEDALNQTKHIMNLYKQHAA